jgi:hypothetical protein
MGMISSGVRRLGQEDELHHGGIASVEQNKMGSGRKGLSMAKALKGFAVECG